MKKTATMRLINKEDMLKISCGRVDKVDTINYRNGKLCDRGLFSLRIFIANSWLTSVKKWHSTTAVFTTRESAPRMFELELEKITADGVLTVAITADLSEISLAARTDDIIEIKKRVIV